MAEWDAFEQDQVLVREKLTEGHIDHLEVVSTVTETQFFHRFLGTGDLAKLAAAYPNPRKREEVPLYIYLATQLTLRLHGSSGYSSLPYVLHCGGLRDALEGEQVVRKLDPATGERFLEFKGYNKRNDYARRTPCDHDFVRKVARDTDPRRLEAWYGRDVARYLGDAGAYDPEGIFNIDGSYLFVPDNEHYELSRVAHFDEHNHPISKEDEAKLTPAQRKRCRFRRYYRMVGLSHVSRSADRRLYVGSKLLREEFEGMGEVKALVPMVRDFVETVGKGVMRLLVMDRGFIDGESIGKIKDLGIDVLLPLKAKMLLTEDAWKLSEVDGKPWQVWTPPPKVPPPHPPQRPEHIRRREENRQRTVERKKAQAGIEPPVSLVRLELKVIPRMDIWDECPVPLNVVLMREHMSDGTLQEWGLMTTREVGDPVDIRTLYHLRTSCEEGWRQTKCFWDLTGFRSTSFSLVTSQVIFVLFAYSLLQLFLLKSDRGDMAQTTRQRLLAELLPDGEKVAVYWQNRVGYFGVKEYTAIILNLPEGARRRLLGTVRRLTRLQSEPPALPERPTLR